MGNPVSFHFSSREKNSEYGHLPYLLLKLHQVSIKKKKWQCFWNQKWPQLKRTQICALVIETFTKASEILDSLSPTWGQFKFLHLQLLYAHKRNSHTNRIWKHSYTQLCVRGNSTWQKRQQELSLNTGQNTPVWRVVGRDTSAKQSQALVCQQPL